MATILFGGSFDPIHNGHLAMAKAALSFLPNADLLLIPAACSPFKTGQNMASEPHRLTMCRLVAKTESRIDVSDVEFFMEKPSYTVRTVEKLQKIKPDDYYFLCGADAFLSLQRWKEYETLIRLVTFLVADRSGAFPRSLLEQKEAVERDGGKVFLLPMDKVAVSSTQIRRYIGKGNSIARLVPSPVERYIVENSLYKE